MVRYTRPRTAHLPRARPLPSGTNRIISAKNAGFWTKRDVLRSGRFVLNVRTEAELLDAVRSVLGCLDDDGARGYVRRMAISHSQVAMHAVVQEMVRAQSSGVLFTVNPVSGRDDEMVVNATWGLGEPLVSGRITPDQIVIDKSTLQCKSYVIGPKEQTLSSSGLDRTPPEKAAARCMDEYQLRRLAEVGCEGTGLGLVPPPAPQHALRQLVDLVNDLIAADHLRQLAAEGGVQMPLVT